MKFDESSEEEEEGSEAEGKRNRIIQLVEGLTLDQVAYYKYKVLANDVSKIPLAEYEKVYALAIEEYERIKGSTLSTAPYTPIVVSTPASAEHTVDPADDQVKQPPANANAESAAQPIEVPVPTVQVTD